MIKELKEAQKILGLDRDLTVKDYKEIKSVEKLLKTDADKKFYGWILEGLEQRLPEIAALEGSYKFVED